MSKIQNSQGTPSLLHLLHASTHVFRMCMHTCTHICCHMETHIYSWDIHTLKYHNLLKIVESNFHTEQSGKPISGGNSWKNKQGERERAWNANFWTCLVLASLVSFSKWNPNPKLSLKFFPGLKLWFLNPKEKTLTFVKEADLVGRVRLSKRRASFELKSWEVGVISRGNNGKGVLKKEESQASALAHSYHHWGVWSVCGQLGKLEEEIYHGSEILLQPYLALEQNPRNQPHMVEGRETAPASCSLTATQML